MLLRRPLTVALFDPPCRCSHRAVCLCVFFSPVSVSSPESQGVVSGVVFVVVLIFLQLQYAVDNRLALIEYNAALHSIGFMIFLGFADDVVDLPWRYKLILPTVATLPLLVAYSGSTYIAVPWPLVDIIGSSINLGILYQVRTDAPLRMRAEKKRHRD
jgi:hypothetical protein